MLYRALADATMLAHFAFVLFVVFGGLLVFRWRRMAWVHIPVAMYGAIIEFAGFVCPLTPLENSFRQKAGEVGYGGGFVEHYLFGVIYPEGLTREIQIVLGMVVILFNAAVYGLALRRGRSRGADS